MKARGLVLDSRRYRTSVSPPAGLEDTSRFGNDGTFAHGGGGATDPQYVQLPSGLWVISFDRSEEHYVTIPNMRMNGDKTFELVAIPSFDASDAGQYFFLQWFIDIDNYINLDKIALNPPTTFAVAAGGINGTAQVTYPWNAGEVLIIHAVLDYTTAPHRRLYINGQLEADSGAVGIGTMSSSMSTLYIGCKRTPDDFWDGKLALPRIYSYALSAADIYAHYQTERRFFGV
ncbi:hypothetical protein ES703_47203 [subsurface metagenome]